MNHAACAIVMAAEHWGSNEPVNIRTGQEITIQDLAHPNRRRKRNRKDGSLVSLPPNKGTGSGILRCQGASSLLETGSLIMDFNAHFGHIS
jgi:hypothetical protein